MRKSLDEFYQQLWSAFRLQKGTAVSPLEAELHKELYSMLKDKNRNWVWVFYHTAIAVIMYVLGSITN